MKKTLFLLLICGLMLAFSSCKRSELDDPVWDDPAGFQILLEGSANPAVFFIDGRLHSSEIYVRVTDSSNRPLAGKTIFFEQVANYGDHDQVNWGYFESYDVTVRKVTNGNGEVWVKFYSPTKFYSGAMFLHAVMQIDGHAYRGSDSHVGNVPQDWIAVTMYNSTPAGQHEVQ